MVAVVNISRRIWPMSWFDRWRHVDAYATNRGRILDTARRYARTLGEEVSIVSARAPGRGRFYFYLGHMLGWGGLALALFGLMRVDEAHLEKLLFGPFGLGLLMQLPSGALVRAGRRLLQPTATEAIAADQRRPVLLLRSFRDDDAEIVNAVSAKGDVELGGLEETIGPPFTTYGPFIAIGKPGEETVRLGAARERFGQSDWKGAIGRWMDQAVLLLVVPGLTSGLAWEMEAIARRKHGHKMLVLMPPANGYWPWQGKGGGDWSSDGERIGFDYSYSWQPKSNWSWEWDRAKGKLRSTREIADEKEAARQQRWANLRAAFGQVPGFSELPEKAPVGLIAVHLSGSGEAVLITGPEVPRGRDYLRAIAFAVYGMKCHGKW